MLAPMLQHLDFASESGELIPGLVALKDGETSVDRPDERLAVRDALAIAEVDYVFFRRFSDSRSSQVVAYIVDNADNHLSETALAELHKRVWLHGGVPLLYVAWPARLDILTCARGPDFWEGDKVAYRPADRIAGVIAQSRAITQAMEDRYSAWRLADGTFWDDPQNAPLADSKKRAHERLIQAVVDTDKAMEGEQNPLLRTL